jgi:type II protein arginine methyltransferase
LSGPQSLDPSNGLCWLNVATVHLMAGRLGDARTALQGALEREPSLARAHTSMGVLEAREGHRGAAIEQWKQAVALNPGRVGRALQPRRLPSEGGTRR